MFKRGRFLNKNTITSDEGYSVETVGRDMLRYIEGGRKMSITADISVFGFVIFVESIGRWDDNPAVSESEKEKSRIASNIKSALESQGKKVEFV